MENPTEYIVDKIQTHVLDSLTDRSAISLIKVHDRRLGQFGDISFPLNAYIWSNYFKMPLECKEDSILTLNSDTEEEALAMLVECGITWTFPLKEIKLTNDRCALFLERKKITELLFHKILTANDYGFKTKNPEKLIYLDKQTRGGGADNLSEYRAELVKKILSKLLALSDWTEVDDYYEEDALTISVESITTKCPSETIMNTVIKCGVVLDPKSGKVTQISPEEYKYLRRSDMRHVSMNKYGGSVKELQDSCDLFDRLGEAAVTIDLLQVKSSSPVNMIRTGHTGNKGATFIFYNSARLESLFRNFKEKVEKGIYEPLPPLKEIDLGLLSSEDEWELIFGYIFTYPNVTSRCIENIESGICSTHYLIKFLEGLVSTFSVYYRRTRILTETRAHLMPTVYARLYLLKTIQKIFYMALSLLEIEPVQFM